MRSHSLDRLFESSDLSWSEDLEAMEQFIDVDGWRFEMATMEAWTVERLNWLDSALIEEETTTAPAPLATAG